MSIKQAIMKGHDIKIDAGDGEWEVECKWQDFEYVPLPSIEEWNCYQAIARHLLAIKALPSIESCQKTSDRQNYE